MRKVILILILFPVSFFACRRPPAALPEGTARVTYYGLITCFSDQVTQADRTPVSCETSAVALDGSQLIFGSDKPVPGDTLSAVFSTELRENDNLSGNLMTYFTNPVFKQATKYEEFTRTPDGNYFLGITAFDRFKESSSEWDGYNTLLFWKKGSPETAQVVAASVRNGFRSSIDLRKPIARALSDTKYPQGPPYFKIEGMVCLPGDRLLLGIREMGESYQQFAYSIRLVETTYRIRNDSLMLHKSFTPVYTFRPDPSLTDGKKVAVSGLAYDPFYDRLYLLTSYEETPDVEGIGGYLWLLPLEGLKRQQPPVLVRDTRQQPLRFAHKPEGIAVLGKGKLFVIHDDDRVTGREGLRKGDEPFFRKPNQAAYTVLIIQ